MQRLFDKYHSRSSSGRFVLPSTPVEGSRVLLSLVDTIASSTLATRVLFDGEKTFSPELLDSFGDLLTCRLVAGPPDLRSDLFSSDPWSDEVLISYRDQVIKYTSGEVVELPRRGLLDLCSNRRSVYESSKLIFDRTESITDLLKLFFASTVRAFLDPLSGECPEQRRELGLRVPSFKSNLEKLISKIARDDEPMITFLLRRHVRTPYVRCGRQPSHFNGYEVSVRRKKRII